MPKTTHSPADAHTPLLIVLSGPSGVGKDTVLARMRELGSPYHFTVTATTRPRREGERDGVDYIFIPERRFLTMKDAGELLEWANVYGNYYGVPRSQVTGALREGKDVVMKIDVQGAATIRKNVPEALFIFLAPPSMDELARRLGERMTESPESLRRRLETARSEMGEAAHFDHVVPNHSGHVDDTVAEIERLAALRRGEGQSPL